MSGETVKQRGKRLILSRRADVLFRGEPRQERRNVGRAQRGRMRLLMKADISKMNNPRTSGGDQ